MSSAPSGWPRHASTCAPDRSKRTRRAVARSQVREAISPASAFRREVARSVDVTTKSCRSDGGFPLLIEARIPIASPPRSIARLRPRRKVNSSLTCVAPLLHPSTRCGSTGTSLSRGPTRHRGQATRCEPSGANCRSSPAVSCSWISRRASRRRPPCLPSDLPSQTAREARAFAERRLEPAVEVSSPTAGNPPPRACAFPSAGSGSQRPHRRRDRPTPACWRRRRWRAIHRQCSRTPPRRRS
jgi:hypothetical protein